MVAITPSESPLDCPAARFAPCDSESAVAPIGSRPTAVVKLSVGPASSRFVAVGLAVVAGLVAGAGLLAVVLAGFTLSFDAIGSVGQASGVRPHLAWLLPAAVDGAMAVGTVTAVVVRRLQRPTVYPWAVVLVNTGISVACNGLHAYGGTAMELPTAIAVAVSAVPAVNLALSVHLLVLMMDAVADVLLDRTTMRTAGDGVQEIRTRHQADDQLPTNPPAEEEAGEAGESLTPPDVRRLSGRKLQRAAWKRALNNRRSDGSLPSGTEIARAHGRSARWGRLVRQAGISGSLFRGIDA